MLKTPTKTRLALTTAGHAFLGAVTGALIAVTTVGGLWAGSTLLVSNDIRPCTDVIRFAIGAGWDDPLLAGLNSEQCADLSTAELARARDAAVIETLRTQVRR
jgi:hypothetical protein